MRLLKSIIIVLAILLSETIHAQTYDLQSSTINSGYGTSNSGSYQLNGAVGEITGVSTSTAYQLNAGSISNRIASQVNPGLIAHYPFDGNLDDLSGNMYAGVYDGTQSYDLDVAGLDGRAFDFDGATHVFHPLNQSINFTGVTLSAWVNLDNPNVTGVFQNIVALESETAIIQLGYADNSYFIYFDNGTSIEEFSFGTTTTGFHHVVVTWTGTTINAYVDGQDLGTSTTTVSLATDIDTLSMGADNFFGGEFLQGDLDEVKIYNYALSLTEVQDLYNSYPPPPPAPQNVVARVISPTSIQVSWDDTPLETYYYLYWDDGTNFGEIGFNQNETSYTITDLETDVEYFIYLEAGNDFGGFNATELFATPVNNPIQAQSVPEYFILDETVTIQYFETLSYPIGEMDTASTVFMHASLIGIDNTETGIFKAEMTYNFGVWEFTMDPRLDFDLSNDFVAKEMSLYFTNGDSSAFGFAANLETIKLPAFDPTNIAPIGGFLTTDALTDVYIDDVSTFTPANVQLANLSSYTVEALINFGDVNPGIGSFTAMITRGFDDGVGSYEPYHGIVYYEFDEFTAYPTSLVSEEISGFADNRIIMPEIGVNVTGIPGGEAYSNGTWAHVALVYTTPSNGNADLYVNGIYQGFVEVINPTILGNSLRIGQFSGGVDELRIWSYPRTQDQIRMDLKNEIDPSTSGLIGYWRMNSTTDISGTTYILDETSSANDFVVANAVITELPDLDVISLALNPKSIAQDETQSMSYTIENIGSADAVDAFDLEFYLSADNTFDGTDVLLSTVNFPDGLLLGESVFNIVQATIPAATADGDYFVIAVLDDAGVVQEENETNNTASATLNINAANVNNVATSITLDNYSFTENADVGTIVGAISYNDPDEDLFDLALVAGTGDTDNGLFQIVGGELITNAVRDFEIDATSYSVRIQVDDNRGGIYEEAIQISLTDVNEAPTDITLTNSSIVAGETYFESVIGMLETVDQDNNENHSYAITIENNANASFLIDGSDNLLITVNNPSETDVFTLTIQSTDKGGLTTSKELTITVSPAGIAPNNLLLSNNTINENHGAGATIGQFFAIDEDSDTFTYALVGGADQSEFSVSSSGVLTQNNENLAQGSYSIQVTATDDTDLSITRTFTITVIGNAVSNVISIGGEQSNYRIIGVPFTNATIANTFPDLSNENNSTGWRIFGFSNGNTSELRTISSQLRNGNGYWFISNIQQSVELGANNVNTAPTVPKALQQGWNLIGNPFLTTLDWNTVLNYNINTVGSISSSDVDAQIFIWNGSWNQVSQLGVMQGGFVNASTASSGFAFPSATASLGSARTTATRSIIDSYFDHADAWQLYLNLESKGISSNISGVGLNSTALDDQDRMDIAPPPTPAIFNALQLTEKATGLTKNIKAVNESVFWDFILTGSEETTTITWDQGIVSMLDEPLMIALLPQGDVYDMSSMAEITFTPEKNQSVMVIYGDEMPKELLFNAITAYPNPVEQEVNFRFFVDQEGVVPASVELYNLTGKQLGSINQMATGGQWNEINYKVGTQDLLKSGIYLFKVRYEGFESVMKKLIVK